MFLRSQRKYCTVLNNPAGFVCLVTKIAKIKVTKNSSTRNLWFYRLFCVATELLFSFSGDSLPVCEIWNTLEPHFQQVGYQIDIQVSSLGKCFLALFFKLGM